MSVLADTSVLSLVLRRRKRPMQEGAHAAALRRMLDDDEAVAIAGITATAIGHDAELLTTDDDFERMAPHCGLHLFAP